MTEQNSKFTPLIPIQSLREMRLFFILLFSCSFTSLDLNAEILRRLFSPWSSVEAGGQLRYAWIHDNVEVVLNHFGITVDYVDFDTSKLPDPRKQKFKKEYRGIVLGYTGEKLPNSKKLFRFFKRAVEAGIPIYVIGRFGFLDAIERPELERTFKRLNLSLSNTTETLFMSTSKVNKNYFGFEKKIPPVLHEAPPFKLKNGKGESLLTIDLGRKIERSTPVFISKILNLAWGPYSIHADKMIERKKWVLDPYKFFQHSLQFPKNLPYPDVNVINGARVYFSHIDGDAAHSISKINRYRYTSEIIFDEVVKKYPTLPLGVSFIVAEVDPEVHGNEKILNTAKKTLRQNNVEAASHSYFHPLFWSNHKTSYSKMFFNYFNAKTETIDSLRWIEKNLNNGKKLCCMYWSGDTAPGKEEHNLLAKHGYLNMNGGDSVFDKENPSRTYLSPLGTPVGNHYQVFTGNANENIYTDGWSKDFYSFKNVIETFVNTENPDIIKPINPYYHFYSADRPIALKAVDQAINWALRRNIAPIFPSTYIKSVLAFRNLKVKKVRKNEFLYQNAKGLFTLRIDQKDLAIDLKNSEGVIGFGYLKRSMYIYLEPNREDYRVKLTDRKSFERKNKLPYLSYSGGAVSLIQKQNKLEITVLPFTRAPIEIKNIPKAPKIKLIDGKFVAHQYKDKTLTIQIKPHYLEQKIEVAL